MPRPALGDPSGRRLAREDHAIFRFRKLETRLRGGFLLLALVPLGLVIGAALLMFRPYTVGVFGPGYVRSVTNAGRLVGELVARYEEEARAALDALPPQPLPPDSAGAADLPARLGVDFVAWGGDDGHRATLPESAGIILGLPDLDDWHRVVSGGTPSVQAGRVLRFFRPGADGAPARAVGWILSEETASMLLSARDDFGRIMQLQLHWRTLQRGFLVIVPVIFLAAGAAAFFAARRTARLTARPIVDLAETADALAAGDLSRRAPVSGEGEVRDLVLAFNRMGGQLESSREELLRVERVAAWRDVARRIAHEIKNPLTPIRLAIHRLQGRVPESDESSRECLRSIDEEVESLGRIAAAFSEFAKMPAPEPAPTDFAAIARGVVELFRDAAPGVETSFEGPDTLPIVADRDQLRRAATNLVKNAQEAVGGAGGGGTVRVTLRREGGRAVLEVADDGPGIPEEIRDTLFRPGVSAKPGGSGLGLAMVHRIATDHRGALQWRGHEAGTRFVLEIPLDPSEIDR